MFDKIFTCYEGDEKMNAFAYSEGQQIFVRDDQIPKMKC